MGLVRIPLSMVFIGQCLLVGAGFTAVVLILTLQQRNEYRQAIFDRVHLKQLNANASVLGPILTREPGIKRIAKRLATESATYALNDESDARTMLPFHTDAYLLMDGDPLITIVCQLAYSNYTNPNKWVRRSDIDVLMPYDSEWRGVGGYYPIPPTTKRARAIRSVSETPAFISPPQTEISDSSSVNNPTAPEGVGGGGEGEEEDVLVNPRYINTACLQFKQSIFVASVVKRAVSTLTAQPSYPIRLDVTSITVDYDPTEDPQINGNSIKLKGSTSSASSSSPTSASSYLGEWTTPYLFFDPLSPPDTPPSLVTAFVYPQTRDPKEGIPSRVLMVALNISHVAELVREAQLSEVTTSLIFDNANEQFYTISDGSIPLYDTKRRAAWKTHELPPSKFKDQYFEALRRCPPDSCEYVAFESSSSSSSSEIDIVSLIAMATDSGIHFHLLQSTPKSYFFEISDRNRVVGIVIGVCAAFTILVSCVLILWAIRSQLRLLTASMQLAANMRNDEAREQNEKSKAVLSEMRTIQLSFEAMNTQLLLARPFLPQSLLVVRNLVDQLGNSASSPDGEGCGDGGEEEEFGDPSKKRGGMNEDDEEGAFFDNGAGENFVVNMPNNLLQAHQIHNTEGGGSAAFGGWFTEFLGKGHGNVNVCIDTVSQEANKTGPPSPSHLGVEINFSAHQSLPHLLLQKPSATPSQPRKRHGHLAAAATHKSAKTFTQNQRGQLMNVRGSQEKYQLQLELKTEKTRGAAAASSVSVCDDEEDEDKKEKRGGDDSSEGDLSDLLTSATNSVDLRPTASATTGTPHGPLNSTGRRSVSLSGASSSTVSMVGGIAGTSMVLFGGLTSNKKKNGGGGGGSLTLRGLGEKSAANRKGGVIEFLSNSSSAHGNPKNAVGSPTQIHVSSSPPPPNVVGLTSIHSKATHRVVGILCINVRYFHQKLLLLQPTTTVGSGAGAGAMSASTAAGVSYYSAFPSPAQGGEGGCGGGSAPPPPVVDLQRLHQLACAVVESAANKEKGIVDSLQGDHFIVTFNAARPVGSVCQAGARAAMHIADEAERIDLLHKNPFSMGFANGKALVGNMGTDTIKKFCTIGRVFSDAVALERVARRVGQHCVIGDRTRQDLEGFARTLLLGKATLAMSRAQQKEILFGPKSPTAQATTTTNLFVAGVFAPNPDSLFPMPSATSLGHRDASASIALNNPHTHTCNNAVIGAAVEPGTDARRHSLASKGASESSVCRAGVLPTNPHGSFVTSSPSPPTSRRTSVCNLLAPPPIIIEGGGDRLAANIAVAYDYASENSPISATNTINTVAYNKSTTKAGGEDGGSSRDEERFNLRPSLLSVSESKTNTDKSINCLLATASRQLSTPFISTMTTNSNCNNITTSNFLSAQQRTGSGLTDMTPLSSHTQIGVPVGDDDNITPSRLPRLSETNCIRREDDEEDTGDSTYKYKHHAASDGVGAQQRRPPPQGFLAGPSVQNTKKSPMGSTRSIRSFDALRPPRLESLGVGQTRKTSTTPSPPPPCMSKADHSIGIGTFEGNIKRPSLVSPPNIAFAKSSTSQLQHQSNLCDRQYLNSPSPPPMVNRPRPPTPSASPQGTLIVHKPSPASILFSSATFVYAVMGMVTAARNDEWLYELSEGLKDDPFSVVNGAINAILLNTRDVERTEGPGQNNYHHNRYGQQGVPFSRRGSGAPLSLLLLNNKTNNKKGSSAPSGGFEDFATETQKFELSPTLTSHHCHEKTDFIVNAESTSERLPAGGIVRRKENSSKEKEEVNKKKASKESAAPVFIENKSPYTSPSSPLSPSAAPRTYPAPHISALAHADPPQHNTLGFHGIHQDIFITNEVAYGGVGLRGGTQAGGVSDENADRRTGTCTSTPWNIASTSTYAPMSGPRMPFFEQDPLHPRIRPRTIEWARRRLQRLTNSAEEGTRKWAVFYDMS